MPPHVASAPRHALFQLEAAYLNRFGDWVRSQITGAAHRLITDPSASRCVRLAGRWGGQAVSLVPPGRCFDNDNQFEPELSRPSASGLALRLADGSEINLFSAAGRVHVSSVDFQWMSDGPVHLNARALPAPPEALHRLLVPTIEDRRRSTASAWPVSMERRRGRGGMTLGA